MRVRFLKTNPLWDAFLLDLEKELPKVRGRKALERRIRQLLRMYLAVGLKSTGISWKETASIMWKHFGFRLTKKHRTYLQKARIPKEIRIEPRSPAVTLKEVLGDLCPTQLAGARVSRNPGMRMKEKLERKLRQRRKLKLIDRVSLMYIENEYLFSTAYGKRFSSRLVAAYVVKHFAKAGVHLSENSVLKEIRKRLYRRYLRQRGISS